MIVLLQSFRVYRWKNFENLLTVDKDIDLSWCTSFWGGQTLYVPHRLCLVNARCDVPVIAWKWCFRKFICGEGKNCQRLSEARTDEVRHHSLPVHALLCPTARGSTTQTLLPTATDWQRNADRVSGTAATPAHLSCTLDSCRGSWTFRIVGYSYHSRLWAVYF